MEKKFKYEEYWKNHMLTNVSMVLSSLLISCSTEEPDIPPTKDDTSQEDVVELDPFDSMGSFDVGHRQIEHSYQPLEGQPERTIIIDIWYPTMDTSGEMGTYVYGTDEDVFEEATLADHIHQNGYPIHLHSHGFQGWGATSSFLMRYFASHGWIAIAPNHTNNLLADHEDPLPTEHFIHRPMDLTQSLDVISQDDFFNSSNLIIDRVLMSGHSFGASYSTWGIAGASYDQVEESCTTGDGLAEGSCTDQELEVLSSGTLSDTRIKAIIPFAGTIRKAFFGDTGYQTVQGPVLFMSGTEDGHEAAQNHFDEVTGIDFSWLSLEGGCHQTFALGQCATLDVETGFNIVETYALAFARKHILQIENDDIEKILSAEIQPWSSYNTK